MKKDKRKRGKQAFDSPLPARLAYNPAASAASGVYSAAVGVRNFAYDALPALSRRLDRPVISVGGIRAGGVGKTPVALLVGRHIIDNCGRGVVFLSRGYGRVSKKTVIVGPREWADWEEAGDEPAMLHANLPDSWLGIGADRAAAAKKLSPLIPERSVFILDDGFQRRQVRRDLDIVCLSEGAFRDRLMPAGYLREPASSLARADVVLVVGAEGRMERLREVKEAVEREFIHGGSVGAAVNTPIYNNTPVDNGADSAGAQNPKKPRICAILLQYPVGWVEARTGRVSETPPLPRPAVVTGIARPERFTAMLRSLAVEPSAVYNFRDHYKFKRNDLAFAHNIYLDGVVTTEKDSVRLLSPEFADLREVWYLKIGLRFADSGSEAAVLSIINGIAS